mmetsp:Transcript_10852/g.25787  ORF Transcript_10852/g.25787 Transcript_10852/m.25787 type:complete len:237 (+) Transcript_10852:404-1114(+)
METQTPPPPSPQKKRGPCPRLWARQLRRVEPRAPRHVRKEDRVGGARVPGARARVCGPRCRYPEGLRGGGGGDGEEGPAVAAERGAAPRPRRRRGRGEGRLLQDRRAEGDDVVVLHVDLEAGARPVGRAPAGVGEPKQHHVYAVLEPEQPAEGVGGAPGPDAGEADVGHGAGARVREEALGAPELGQVALRPDRHAVVVPDDGALADRLPEVERRRNRRHRGVVPGAGVLEADLKV